MYHRYTEKITTSQKLHAKNSIKKISNIQMKGKNPNKTIHKLLIVFQINSINSVKPLRGNN